MNIPLVDLKAQYLGIRKEMDSAISEVLSSTAFIGGRFVENFEKAFAGYCQTKHCVGVGNGTDALFIALKALGVGHGDEVITVANSFIATSEAVSMTGAKVVFVDINPRTYNIDVNKIEEKITSHTRAILPVHLYGQPADMDPILSLANKHGLKVVGDAAQAHGAMYKGRPIASCADLTCFSFYPGKNLGAYGDAGAVATNDDALADRVRMIANHGRLDKYNHLLEGVNSRLDGIQAAVLCTKLPHLVDWTESRRRNASTYNRCLKGLQVVTPQEIDDVRAVYHLFVVRIDSKVRRPLQDFLKERGISTGIHYPIALPYLKAYGYLNLSEQDFPEALKASGEILSLPMYPELEESQIAYIGESMRAFGL
ncbi:MAG: DegT/DnrJ/EryC1/StrS family aminotransferase [Candidatus Latescibacter sp.]|nr:DegT/DnrJ/EryC1/StrS family aminotransferase [Candidatus Latescibacter sp.]